MDRSARQTGTPAGSSRRRHRRRWPDAPQNLQKQSDAKTQAPAVALSQSHDIRSRPTLEPLSPAEIAELKQHFAFLRQHRKVLKLRLNAQEDLLLNGAREPSDRGVCQHLLAKIELSRVAAVVERWEPNAATSLLGGIVRFSSDVGFLLLYLESVRRSSSQAEAAATLAFGLRQIDFAELSPAQLRRVLDLVVEVFDPATRPEILLGLLASKSFRRALDESVASLPEALVGYVSPLRAVHAVVLRGTMHAHGSDALRRGVALFLGGTARTLGRQPLAVRERLFRLGLALFKASDGTGRPGLDALLASFRSEPARYRELALARAGHWLASACDQEAKRLLAELCREQADFASARHWLEALNAPRVGRVALMGKPGRPQGEHRPRRFHPGFWLDRQTEVWVTVAEPAEKTSLIELTALWQRLCLPGVAPVVAAGETEEGRAYLTVPHLGRSLAKRLAESRDLEESEAVSTAHETCLLLAALAEVGVSLPDAAPARFSVDPRGRIWLMDLIGATETTPEVAGGRHLGHARALLSELGRRAPRWIVAPELEAALAATDHVKALVRVLRQHTG
jgi:hypothetical protein